MTNLDTKQQKKLEIKQSIVDAIREQDEQKISDAFEQYGAMVTEDIIATVNGRLDSTDETTILASRGVRQLTRKEREYYKAFAEAATSGNPQMAVANIDVTFPETIINETLKDIRTEHPLLDLIDFRNTTAITSWLINTAGVQMAKWGKIGDEITKELNGGFDKVSTELCKLSAFFPVSQDLFRLGLEWIDVYVRSMLREAIALGLETGIVDGTGHDQPIGMTRDLAAAIDPTNGYAQKTAVAITDFSIPVYSGLIGTLIELPNGKVREIKEIALIVNPLDYFKIVLPATTIQKLDGTYLRDVLPYPTHIIKSAAVPRGKAILGMPYYYFMGLGTAKDGKIEYSDEARFLQDQRVYKIVLLGNGLPKDNKAFIVLDISGVQPTYLNVGVASMPQQSVAVTSLPQGE